MADERRLLLQSIDHGEILLFNAPLRFHSLIVVEAAVSKILVRPSNDFSKLVFTARNIHVELDSRVLHLSKFVLLNLRDAVNKSAIFLFDILGSRLAPLLLRKFCAVVQCAIQVPRIAVLEAVNGGSSLLDARVNADLLLVK